MAKKKKVVVKVLNRKEKKPDKYAIVDKLLGKLTLEQKVGQLFTQAYYGSLITPDVVNMIKKMNCGGFRITEFYRQFRRYARPGEERQAFDKSNPGDIRPAKLFNDVKDILVKPPYLTVPQYCEVLNQLKAIAKERPYDIPLICSLDQEGDGSADFVRGDLRFFPSQMGLARTNNPELVYEACKASGRMLAAVGFNMVHSPVVDISYNPEATYVGMRAFSHDVDITCKMAVAAVKGYQDGGVIATAKHYPGRGDNALDDHVEISTIERPDHQLRAEDLKPYAVLARNGLGAVMVGHTVYPAWGDDCASVSKKIVTDILRGDLKFEGLITTDSMIMGAIAIKYGIPRACVLAAKAGANIILMKECGPIRDEAYRLMMEAAKNGELSEDHIDGLLAQTLRTKVDFGLFNDKKYMPDPEKAMQIIGAPKMRATEAWAANESIEVLRDEAGVLPLKKNERVLLIEQIAEIHANANDKWHHAGMFWEEMLKQSDEVGSLEIETGPKADDVAKTMEYSKYFDVIVMTYFFRRENVEKMRELIDQVMATGKKVVIVSNSPLPYHIPKHWKTVVVNYGVAREHLRAAAEVLYGKRKIVKVKK
jgi:beta-N-acetylhexosaminidase